MARLCAHANIGGNTRKIEGSATVDHDGNLWIKAADERLPGHGAAQSAGESSRIENFRHVESGERIAQDWHAILGGNPERGNGAGKPRRRIPAQAAHLNTAARGDFYNAIATGARCRA